MFEQKDAKDTKEIPDQRSILHAIEEILQGERSIRGNANAHAEISKIDVDALLDHALDRLSGRTPEQLASEFLENFRDPERMRRELDVRRSLSERCEDVGRALEMSPDLVLRHAMSFIEKERREREEQWIERVFLPFLRENATVYVPEAEEETKA